MFLLSLGARIGIIIGISVVGLWVLALIIDLIFVTSFSSIFRKHKKALPVILYTKYEGLKTILNILQQSGMDVDNKYVALLGDISLNDLSEPGSQQFDKSRNVLSYINDELMFIASAHPELNGDDEFMQAKRNILDSDTLYRQTVMMYNADALGYNYWINFLPCRFIFKLFRVKEKKTIS